MKALFAVAAALGIGLAAPSLALADDDDYRRGWGKHRGYDDHWRGGYGPQHYGPRHYGPQYHGGPRFKHKHHHHYYGPPPHAYYGPPPRAWGRPIYVAPPPPVVVYPRPYPAPQVSIGFGFHF